MKAESEVERLRIKTKWAEEVSSWEQRYEEKKKALKDSDGL